MILRDLNEIIDEIKKISVKAGLPVEVEEDKTTFGIDAKILLDNMPIVRHDNFYDMDFRVVLQYSTSKKNYKQLLYRIKLASEGMADDTKFLFDGWIKIEDDSNIIYQANIIYKNMVIP